MNKMISFCINTTKSELDYLKCLFHSLQHNLNNRNHEIIVYVENDFEDDRVKKFLISQKNIFPDLKLIINQLSIPLGYGRNINLMFESAKYEIVSYIQSDMMICPSYDTELLYSLEKLGENTILCSTRIEPPLHPPSPEKITKNFGVYSNEMMDNFKLFNQFCIENINRDKITSFFFAPFTISNKKMWNDIGGHDTVFRRSREDSDILYRLMMKKYNIKQCWNAVVYHRSCVSSRGPNWWTNNAQERTRLQQIADSIEMMKFLRKWPAFKHTSMFDPSKEYKYYISANLYNPTPMDDGILQNYYRFNRIYIDHKETREHIKQEFDKFQDSANILMDVSKENWEKYKRYFNVWEAEYIFPSEPIKNDDVIVNVDLKGSSFAEHLNNPYYNNINDLVHSIREEDPGEYDMEGLNATLQVNKATNHITDNIIASNPPLIGIELQYL